MPDYGTGNWPAEADGCIKCEIITEVSKRVVFVEICRAIGILARLNPVTGKAEGVCEKNGEICFESMEKEVQKILTLSTCIGDGNSSQRLAVHAAVEMIFATKSGREEGSVLE